MPIIRSVIRTQSKAPATQKGAGLIEILISLLVIATGILGLTGLQANSLASNRTAYYRTQATILAYDIIDKQRANKAEALAGNYAIDVNSTAATTTCITDCTTADITAMDLTQWKNSLATELPNGNGSIALIAGITGAYQVTVQWALENQTAATITNGNVNQVVIEMQL
jgi:type IV pilus assembly protein PilV